VSKRRNTYILAVTAFVPFFALRSAAAPIPPPAPAGTAAFIRHDDHRAGAPVTPLERCTGGPVLAAASERRDSGDDADSAFAALQTFLAHPSRGTYGAALRAFRRVAGPTTGSAWAHHATGMLYARGLDIEIAGTAGYLHRRVRAATNAEIHARRELRRAIDRDTAFAEPALELARLALATRWQPTLEDAQSALARVTWRDRADVWIARAHIASALRAHGEAEAAARRAIDISGCSAAWHALAWTLALQERDAEAGSAYVRALGNAASDDERARLLDDVRPLLDAEDRAEVAALSQAFITTWVRDWWERSAARAGRSVAQRIGEQLRRYDHAHRAHRRNGGPGSRPVTFWFADRPPPGSDEARTEQIRSLWIDAEAAEWPWDERGLVQVRHGEPDRILRTTGSSPARFETWVYWHGDETRLFNFAKSGDYPDWVLISGPACNKQFHLERLEYEPRYQRLLRACRAGDRTGALSENLEIRADLQATADVVLRTESAPHRFERALTLAAATYAFRGDRAATRIAALAWVPLGLLLQDSAAEGGRAALGLSVIAMNARGGSVTRIDTVVRVNLSSRATVTGSRSATADTNAPAALRTIVVLQPRPAAEGIVRFIAVDAADVRRGVDRGFQRAFPDFARPSASASDLVIATADASGPLRRGDVSLAPLPDHAGPAGDAFRLYYELYGVAPRSQYTTTIRMVRGDREGLARLLDLFPGRRDAQDLRFQDTAPDDGDVIRVDRTIGGDLLPGVYDLMVEVRTADGVTITRRTTLRINER